LNLSLYVKDEHDSIVFNVAPPQDLGPYPAGLFRDVCHIPGDLMNDGHYTVELLVVHDHSRVVYSHPEILSFDILDSPDLRGAWHGEWPGAVRPILEWQSECLETHELASREPSLRGWSIGLLASRLCGVTFRVRKPAPTSPKQRLHSDPPHSRHGVPRCDRAVSAPLLSRLVAVAG